MRRWRAAEAPNPGGPGLHQRHDEAAQSKGSGGGGCLGSEEKRESEGIRAPSDSPIPLYMKPHQFSAIRS